MKRFLFFFLTLNILSACSQEKLNTPENFSRNVAETLISEDRNGFLKYIMNSNVSVNEVPNVTLRDSQLF